MQFSRCLFGTDDAKRMTDYYRKVFGEPRYEDGDYSADRRHEHQHRGARRGVGRKPAARTSDSGTSRRRTCGVSSTG